MLPGVGSSDSEKLEHSAPCRQEGRQQKDQKEIDIVVEADIERDLVSTCYEEIDCSFRSSDSCPILSFSSRQPLFFFFQGFTESLPWNHARVETQQRRSLFVFSHVR